LLALTVVVFRETIFEKKAMFFDFNNKTMNEEQK
jgi:hypothetical protein